MQITITDEVQSLHRPGAKLLLMQNTGAKTLYYGYESTTVAAAGANQGVPLLAGQQLSANGRDSGLNGNLRLVCASGESTTVNYTFAD